jgi:hypothetical protein
MAATAAADPRVAYRRSAGLAAGAAGLLLIGASFLGWITTPMQSGGRTSISGWGMISGGSDEVDGVNFNDLMAGVGSYRPGAVALVAGAVALIPALIIAVTGAGRRPSRLVGVLLGLCGAVAVAWGLARVIAPGDALGVLPSGQHAAGAGPYLTVLGGVVLVAAAGTVLSGFLDPVTALRAGRRPGRSR